ncbi:MAG TPA: Ldh family oxidoreductase [Thermoplasmata archaeon]|nr:Ldh family oxidoreductase [Thermoplasmata archaeon]
MVDEIRVKKDDLAAFCVAAFEKLGVPRRDAEVATEVLIVADLRDKGSHGVARLARYVEGIQAGLMLPTDRSTVVQESDTTALIDGGKSLGQVVGVKGMDLAIRKAKARGTGFVTARNSNHYGIAGYYALRAVEHGCVGISMTNAAPLVVPTFGRDAILGTNPIAIAIPCEGDPFLFDAATSVVPRGKLEVYDRLGKPMPLGWAVDARGKGTANAKEVLDNLIHRQGGGILPLGGEGEEFSGHKGYGLALAVELLCAALSASAFGGKTYVDEHSANVGHFFGAIDVTAFRPLDDLKAEVREYLDSLKGGPKAEGHDRIYTHGEKGFAFESDCLRRGIPLGPKVVDSLKKIGGQLGVPWPG